jgi:hypothetical protein
MSLPRALRVAALALGMCGCTSARIVSRDPTGGVVAIPSNSDNWPTHYRASAEALMAKQCPKGYVIDTEGEVVIGQSVNDHINADPASLSSLLFGIGSPQYTTWTQDIKEWQIRFRAKDAPPPEHVIPVGYEVATPPVLEKLPDASRPLPKAPEPIAP